MNSILSGCRGLMGAAFVLILAWSIKKVCDDVGTGTVILSLVGDEIQPGYIPLVVFLVSGRRCLFHRDFVGHDGTDATSRSSIIHLNLGRRRDCPRIVGCRSRWGDLG